MTTYPAVCEAPVKDGKMHFSDVQRKLIAAFLKKHEGQDVRVTFSQPAKTRSNKQNRYYWRVVIDMIAAETGHSQEEVHELMKAMHLPRAFVTIAGKEVEIAKSTTTLSTFEFEEYLDRIRAFAAQELNMTIPMPNESGF